MLPRDGVDWASSGPAPRRDRGWPGYAGGRGLLPSVGDERRSATRLPAACARLPARGSPGLSARRGRPRAGSLRRVRPLRQPSLGIRPVGAHRPAPPEAAALHGEGRGLRLAVSCGAPSGRSLPGSAGRRRPVRDRCCRRSRAGRSDRPRLSGRSAPPESRAAAAYGSRPHRARRRRAARSRRGLRDRLAVHALARRLRCPDLARRSRRAADRAGRCRGDAASLGRGRRARARALHTPRTSHARIGRRSAMNVLYAILVLGAVPAAAEILKRRFVGPHELLRKGVHIGDGLLAAALPLFVSFRAIAGIAFFFAGAMALSRRRRIFTAVHDVERSTYGEILYPLGIALLALSFPDWHRYLYGVLVIALADGLAAPVGLRFGRRKL